MRDESSNVVILKPSDLPFLGRLKNLSSNQRYKRDPSLRKAFVQDDSVGVAFVQDNTESVDVGSGTQLCAPTTERA